MENMTGVDFKSATADDNRKLFIETYGCQMNVADSEVIAVCDGRWRGIRWPRHWKRRMRYS